MSATDKAQIEHARVGGGKITLGAKPQTLAKTRPSGTSAGPRYHNRIAAALQTLSTTQQSWSSPRKIHEADAVEDIAPCLNNGAPPSCTRRLPPDGSGAQSQHRASPQPSRWH